MRNALATCVLVLLTVAATTAQDRPDFSGTWMTLTVSPRSGNAVRSGIYNIGTIGGVTSGFPANGPRTQSRHSTRWDGEKLVVDFAYYTDGKLTSEHVEVWSLDGQGLLSITVTDRIVGDASTPTNLVYRRSA